MASGDDPTREPTDPVAGHRGTRSRSLALVAGAIAIAAMVASGVLLAIRSGDDGFTSCVDKPRPDHRIGCVTEQAQAIAAEDGDLAALEAGRAAVRADGLSPIDCHLGMHPLGEQAGADPQQSDLTSLAIEPSDQCDAGYLHGYVVGSVTLQGAAEAASQLRACRMSTQASGECDHAYGHAVVRSLREGAESGSEDAVVAAEREAYERCARVEPDPRAVDRTVRQREHDCQHGVVMELALLAAASGADGRDPCASAPSGRARQVCLEFLPARGLLLGQTWDQVEAECERLDGDDLTWCILGYQAARPDATCSTFSSEALQRACREVERRGH